MATDQATAKPAPDTPTPTTTPHLIVYSLDQDRSTYSLSCFVTKLHFRLRYAGIPYENGLGTRGQAPKEKFPYVKFVDSGELLGDTALIVKRLVEQGRLEDLNAGLAPEERAVDYCLRAMLEDRLYYLVVSVLVLCMHGWDVC